MRFRPTLVIGLVAILAGALPAQVRMLAVGSAPAVVNVTPRQAGVVEAEPGDVVRAAFQITNLWDGALDVRGTISVPTHWSVVVGARPLLLAARATDSWLLMIRVPSTVAAGEHVVQLTARANGLELYRDSLIVRVTERRRIDVTLAEAPRFAVAGEAYLATIVVRNRGNGPAGIRLRATTTQGVRATVAETQMHLGAGESRTSTVRVTTDAARAGAGPDHLRVTVLHAGDSTVRAEASAAVPLVVPARAEGDRFEHIAGSLRLRAVSDMTAMVPLDYLASGRLPGDGSRHLTVALRGPGPGNSPWGDSDDYRLELRAPTHDLRLGDQHVVLSPLVEAGTGFGAGGRVDRGDYSLSSYAIRNRHSSRINPRAGVALTRAVSSRLSVSGVAASAGGEDAGQVAGGRVVVTPHAGLVMDGETATSSGPRGTGAAWGLRAAGMTTRTSWEISRREWARDFSGPQRGMRQDHAAAGLRPRDGLTLDAFFNQTHNESGEDALTGFTSDNTSVGAGARIGGAFALELRRSTRGWAANGVADGVTEQSVRAVASRGVGAFRITEALELGSAAYRSTGAASRLIRSTTSATGTVHRRLTVASSVDLRHGASHRLESPTAVTITGNAAAPITRGTTVAVNYVGFRALGVTGVGYADLGARVERSLAAGTGLSLNLRRREMAGDRPRSVVFLEYTRPLALPVQRRAASRRIVGVLLDAETRAPLSNRLVKVGRDVAITDAAGQLALDAPEPGSYPVELAHAAPGDLVLAAPVAVAVDTASSEDIRFTAFAVRPARIEGRLRLYGYADTTALIGDSTVDAGAVANALVALVSGGDTLRRITNGVGRFEVADLPPGTWTISVLSADIPPSHGLDRLSPFTIAPGETRRLLVRASPRERRVTITSGGELRLPPDSSASRTPRDPKAQKPR